VHDKSCHPETSSYEADPPKNFPGGGPGGCAFRSPRPTAPIRGFPRVCHPSAAARSSRRRRYAHFVVHLCIFPQLFGGAERRQKYRVQQFILRRIRFYLCTRPCLAELLLASRWHQSARRGITMHFAILVSGTGPTESIAADAGRVAHLWRATTRVRVPLPVPRGGCACWDKRKLSERARRVVSNFGDVLGWVSRAPRH